MPSLRPRQLTAVKLKFFQRADWKGVMSDPACGVAQNQLHYHVVEIHVQKGYLIAQICSTVSASFSQQKQLSIKMEGERERESQENLVRQVLPRERGIPVGQLIAP